MSEPTQPIFNIEKTYVRDLSLEVPNAPQIFLEAAQPEVQVQLQTKANAVAEDVYECVVMVTVDAKVGDKTVFLVEAQQAGLFRIAGVPEADMDPILSVACPNILFPFVREVIADAVNRAGFPPVLLSPVNFEAAYQQRLAGQAAQAGASIQ